MQISGHVCEEFSGLSYRGGKAHFITRPNKEKDEH